MRHSQRPDLSGRWLCLRANTETKRKPFQQASWNWSDSQSALMGPRWELMARLVGFTQFLDTLLIADQP